MGQQRTEAICSDAKCGATAYVDRMVAMVNHDKSGGLYCRKCWYHRYRAAHYEPMGRVSNSASLLIEIIDKANAYNSD